MPAPGRLSPFSPQGEAKGWPNSSARKRLAEQLATLQILAYAAGVARSDTASSNCCIFPTSISPALKGPACSWSTAQFAGELSDNFRRTAKSGFRIISTRPSTISTATTMLRRTPTTPRRSTAARRPAARRFPSTPLARPSTSIRCIIPTSPRPERFLWAGLPCSTESKRANSKPGRYGRATRSCRLSRSSPAKPSVARTSPKTAGISRIGSVSSD